MAYISRRSALTIIGSSCAALTGGKIARAMETSGRVIYPVAVPIYQTQFVADRIGYFKEAGLDILQVRERAARIGRNPATGEAIKIKASKKIAFRPAKELKEAV